MIASDDLVNTDTRLIPAFELVSQGVIQVLSLDIFDTLLWRKVPAPRDLFLLLGKQLKEEGRLIDAVTVEGFAEIRTKSEGYARLNKFKKAGHEEVTLQEIYWSCSGIFTKITIEEMLQGKNGMINESDVQDLVALEVAWDKKINQFDLNILRLIHKAVQKKITVVLVSDTYLEHDQVTSILDRKEPIRDVPFLSLIHKIFPSCEYGKDKKKGLFLDVIEELQIAPENILHIGDKVACDCVPAQQVGMKALHFPKYDEQFEKIIEREWPENSIARKDQLDDAEGDFGLTAMRSKIAFDQSILNFNKKDIFFWQYGAMCLGPVIAGFIDWIYERCSALGENRVFCLMREGRIYGQLINAHASLYPKVPLQVTELWGSRQYMVNACIAQGNEQELFPLTRSTLAAPYTVGQFCTTIGLDIHKIPKIAKYEHVKFETDRFAEEIVCYISSQDDLRSQIVEHASKKRKNYFKYLSRLVNLSEISHLTIVDVGWVGTIQGALQMMLFLEGYKIMVHGLYLGTEHKSQFALMQGFIREGYLLKAGFPKDDAKAILRGFYMVEQMATSGIGPMVGIDEDGTIVNRPSVIPVRQQRQAEIMQQGIHAFCEQLEKFIRLGVINWPALSGSLTRQLSRILVQNVSRPTRLEANQLGPWQHDHRTGFEHTQSFGKNPYYGKNIIHMLPDEHYKDVAAVWPAAYTAKYDDYLSLAAQAAWSEKMPEECFLSQDVLPMKIFMDHGSGFLKKAAQDIALRSNANRTFYKYLHLTSLKKPIRRLQILLFCPHALIRIRSLHLSINTIGSPNSRQFDFFDGVKEIKGIEWANCKVLSSNTFLCEEKPLSLICTLEDPDIYSIHVRIICESFSMENTSCPLNTE